MTEERPTLLVVDDALSNIDILIDVLGEEYNVRVAVDGASALRSVAKERPDLILLDIMMPAINGYAVCRRLKDDPATRDIPIIFLTALNENADEAYGLGLGAADYITKPFNPAIVKARVRNHLDIKARRELLEAVVAQQTLLLDTVEAQIWFLHDIDTYGQVNRHHADFMGLQKGEMEFKKLDEFLPREVAQTCRESNIAVFKTRKTVESEEWIPNFKGDARLIAVTKTPKIGDDGNVEYIICLGIDITDQRESELQVRKSEENFRSFIETIDDIVVIGNSDGQIIYANPAASTYLGYKHDELKTMKVLDLHPSSIHKEAGAILIDMFSGARDICPLPLASKDGAILPVETRVWFGKWNGLDCMFGISKNLSKEQEALQKFDRIFRINPALMAVSTIPERIFIDINDAFLNTLGYDRQEIIGKTSAELGLFVFPEEQEKIAQLLSNNERIREIELKVRKKNGSIRDGLFSGTVIKSQGTRYFLSVMIDITDRKSAEAKREEAIQELQIALEQVKTLKGIVPICASCKKIRDDKGYWEQVEAYVSRHTDAQFSHGICPECLKILYPEYYGDK
jgi:PAS domain S-box-containing protein